MTPVRSSVVVRVIEVVGGTIAQAVFGALFAVFGVYIAYGALQQKQHDMKLVWTGIGVALFGALIFPSIFPIAQKVVVFFFPNGIPLLGGRRAGDPPANAPPPPPSASH